MPIPHYPPKLDDVICHAGDASDIPLRSPSGSGVMSYAHGFPPITSLPLEAGGVAPLREDLNAALKLLSAHAHYHQVGAPLLWSPELDYIERCEVYGADGVKYVAQRASGPSIPSTGVKDPAAGDETFWKRWDLDISKVPHADTAVRGITRLATADETRDGKLDTIAVTPMGLATTISERTPNASETTRGLVRLATPEEMASDAHNIAVTPQGVHSWWRQHAPCSLNHHGWQRLPSDLFLQWGAVWQDLPPDSGHFYTFPITFPNACLCATVVAINPDMHRSRDPHMQVSGWTRERLAVYSQAVNGAGWCGGYSWMAVGC